MDNAGRFIMTRTHVTGGLRVHRPGHVGSSCRTNSRASKSANTRQLLCVLVTSGERVL